MKRDLKTFAKEVKQFIQIEPSLGRDLDILIAGLNQTESHRIDVGQLRQQLIDEEKAHLKTLRNLEAMSAENSILKREIEVLKERLSSSSLGKHSQKKRSDELQRELSNISQSLDMVIEKGAVEDNLRKKLMQTVRDCAKVEKDKLRMSWSVHFNQTMAKALERQLDAVHTGRGGGATIEEIERFARSCHTSKGSKTKECIPTFTPILGSLLPEAFENFLSLVIASRGEDICDHLEYSLPPEFHLLAIKILSKEFFGWANRSLRLHDVLDKIVRICSLDVSEMPLEEISISVTTSLSCTGVRFWQIDQSRGILTETRSTVASIPLNSDSPVAQAYKTGKVVNKDRFSQAKSSGEVVPSTSLCVPVPNESYPYLVLEAYEKRTAAAFDSEDCYVLSLWGSVCGLVWEKTKLKRNCEWLQYRMSILDEFSRSLLCCESIIAKVALFSETFKYLFKAVETRVHLVFGDFTAQISSNSKGEFILIETLSFVGEVGKAVKSKQLRVLEVDGDGAAPDTDQQVDINLPLYRPSVLFSVPILQGKTVDIVVQFASWKTKEENVSYAETQMQTLAGLGKLSSEAWNFKNVSTPGDHSQASFNENQSNDMIIINKAISTLMAAFKGQVPPLAERRKSYKRIPQLNFIQFFLLNAFIRKMKKRMRERVLKRKAGLL